jgi:ATP-dependent RNA helicase DeaD
MSEPILTTFTDLGLSPPLLQALGEVGYESPSPIQAATIPLLLANRDVLGQAQTGTGKTAAFALPVLSRLIMKKMSPQALVLVPTRELALQVAEAFQRYATHLQGFHVLPIYGGQSYGPQLAALKRGVHVVVGTPGRVIDHLEKGSLDLSALRTLVLDEADEMLRMGFAEDVERILQDTPKGRQTALFSATMPVAIKRIAQTHLREPAEVTVAAKTGTADNIRQRYWLVSGMHKLDALTRILEAEAFDAMIVFARTKLGTEELAGKLQARGFAAVAINGDLQQQQRERIIGQIKDGTVDILVATDVAARGLDVERISHVINFDVPTDPESYTHRIGRTGRAGRSGEAILFITPRERGLLRAIERSTRQAIALMELPTVQAVNNVRIARFKAEITAMLAEGELERYTRIIEEYEREHNVPAIEVAAALAKMSRGGAPLLIDRPKREKRPIEASQDAVDEDVAQVATPPRAVAQPSPESALPAQETAAAPPAKRTAAFRPGESGSRPYRVEVGFASGIKAGNLVGAIANEAQIDAKHIGRIEILETCSYIELPADLPRKRLKHLQTVRVGGQTLRIAEVDAMPAPARKPRSKPTSRG